MKNIVCWGLKKNFSGKFSPAENFFTDLTDLVISFVIHFIYSYITYLTITFYLTVFLWVVGLSLQFH